MACLDLTHSFCVGPAINKLSLSPPNPLLTLPENTSGVLTDVCGIGGTGPFPGAENKLSRLLGGQSVQHPAVNWAVLTGMHPCVVIVALL